jgi:hypothetical protein
MKLRTRVAIQLAALCLLLGASSFAADEASLYIVHGIPGRDIADNLNPNFPVDVLVNGKSCVVRNLAFDTTSAPLSFAAGTYDVQISPSNTIAGCTNPPIIDASVTLTSGTSISAVLAVSGGEPTLLQFSDNLSPVASGNTRFVFAQAADAPALQATLTQLDIKNPKTFTLVANPGSQQVISIAAGTYSVKVYAVGDTTPLAAEQLTLPNQSVSFSYAVGESTNNSIVVINKTVRGVF